jgi:hypothetical protein
MKAPFLPKYKISSEVLIERSLPVMGNIFVKKGSVVQPFDKIGEAKILIDEITFKYDGDIIKKRGDMVSQGEVVAERKKTFGAEVPTISPSTGYIVKIDIKENLITIRKPSRIYDLIAGVPGFVTDVVEGRGVLITTRAVVVKAVFGFGTETGGELVVLGDGGDLISQEDLREEMTGKIIVCGRIDRGLYAKGVAIGVSGFVCGSVNFSATKNFKVDGPEVLITEGFGDIPLSPVLFSYLKTVSGRFAIIRACENEIIIPETDQISWCFESGTLFVELKTGQTAQILSYQNFGSFGRVTSLDDKEGTVTLELIGQKNIVTERVENIGIVVE